MELFTIGYDASSTLGPRTGVGRAALELLRAMVAVGDPHFRFRVLLNSCRHSTGGEHAFLDGNPRVQAYRSRRIGPWMANAWAKGAGPDAESLVGSGIDAWHGPAAYMPPAREARRIATVHDISFLDDPPELRDRMGGAYFTRTLPQLLPQCVRVVTSSEFSRRRLVDEYKLDPARVAVVPLGLDHDLFKPADERFVEIAAQHAGVPDRPWLLAVTSRAPRKRNRLLLDAYAELRRMDPRTPKLVVVGWDAHPPDELRSRPDLHRDVIVAHRVPDQYLPGLYSGAVATIMASRHEGFGLPILEAMACGSPVVCAPLTAMPEVAGDAASYVESDAPAAWAQAIAGIAFDADRRADLRKRGLERAAPFAWEKSARAMLDLYADAAS